MDFPLRILKFRLTHYKGDENETTYVRYLLKTNEAHVFSSIEKISKGYIHSVQSCTKGNKDGFSRYYSSEETAFEALLTWMLGFRLND